MSAGTPPAKRSFVCTSTASARPSCAHTRRNAPCADCVRRRFFKQPTSSMTSILAGPRPSSTGSRCARSIISPTTGTSSALIPVASFTSRSGYWTRSMGPCSGPAFRAFTEPPSCSRAAQMSGRTQSAWRRATRSLRSLDDRRLVRGILAFQPEYRHRSRRGFRGGQSSLTRSTWTRRLSTAASAPKARWATPLAPHLRHRARSRRLSLGPAKLSTAHQVCPFWLGAESDWATPSAASRTRSASTRSVLGRRRDVGPETLREASGGPVAATIGAATQAAPCSCSSTSVAQPRRRTRASSRWRSSGSVSVCGVNRSSPAASRGPTTASGCHASSALPAAVT